MKKVIESIKTFPLLSQGFCEQEAIRWVQEVQRSYQEALHGGNYSFGYTRKAIKKGFLPAQLERVVKSGEKADLVISAKEFAFLQPLNGVYEKWVMDIVSVYKVFKPFRDKMQKCFYHVVPRAGETIFFPMWDRTAEDSPEAVTELLKKQKFLKVSNAVGENSTLISYQDGKYFIAEKEADVEAVKKYLVSFEEPMVITEAVKPKVGYENSTIQMIVFNEHGNNPVIGDVYKTKDIPCWQEIEDTVKQMCRFAPQLEFFCLEIQIVDDGFKILRMHHRPDYLNPICFGPETSNYLRRKMAQKKEFYTPAKIFATGCQQAKIYLLAVLSKVFFPETMKSVKWLREQKKDFLENKDTTLQEKIWAFRHGFVSYRLHQYGITKENWKNYISDLEYRWLRHINNDYRVWMEDKITAKYICSDYNECFPEYYYHIILKNGENKILPMMDCPKELGPVYEDIFKLVQMKRYLALKPDEGSHGNGFYKFTYYDGKYYLNHKETTKEEVLKILQDNRNQYLITEYIDMHPEIKRIYSGAVNTIRMIVFKKDGKNPQIGNAYMRFGSKRTGAVDNMGAGGMYARIDVATGRFYDAKIIEKNEIKPCQHHPDTGELIEGYLPNWEKVKGQILEVAKDIQQLEYFGFDLALTPDGLKFPEINRYPDYPAIETYTPETIDYLLYRLDIKKKQYGYDKRRGCSLIKLPDRR